MRRSQAYKQRSLQRLAFTLMEMLVVVGIIVALMSVGGIYMLGQYRESQVKAARMQAINLSDACQIYAQNHGGFPESLDELTNPGESNTPIIDPPSKLNDPWGRRYTYDKNGSKNAGRRPDIYTPNPYKNGELIGNFDGSR